MSQPLYNKILLFGDSLGLLLLLEAVPRALVAGAVISSSRPIDIPAAQALASELQIPIFIQPGFKTSEYPRFLEDLTHCRPDLILCNSYSMLIRKDVLNLVSGNALNVHASLLPKNRGPNPLQWALIRGETETGVSLHYMNETIDAGDLVAQIRMPIHITDTWVSIRDRATQLIKDLLRKQIPQVIQGLNQRFAQNESDVSVNPRLTPEYPKIDFKIMSDLQIHDLIRAQVEPLRGAYIEKENRRIYFPRYISLAEVASFREIYA